MYHNSDYRTFILILRSLMFLFMASIQCKSIVLLSLTALPPHVLVSPLQINTLVVVAVVAAINVVAVVVTALCVHRIVSRRLSWDLVPFYRQRSVFTRSLSCHVFLFFYLRFHVDI